MLSLLDRLHVIVHFFRCSFARGIISGWVTIAPLDASVPFWKELAIARLRDTSAESVSLTVDAFKVIGVRLRLITEGVGDAYCGHKCEDTSVESSHCFKDIFD